MIKIILRKGREESLRRFHPWVFSGAVAEIQGDPSEGDVVAIYASDGSFLAYGHYQIGSIAVRVLSFDDSAVRPDFWEVMLSKALNVRLACGLHGNEATDCYRLVHGEGDNLPGLIIDYYGGVCVMQAHSVGMFRAKKQITEALKKIYGNSLKAVYDKSSGTAPYKAGLELVDGYMYRSEVFSDDEQIVQENGHKFIVNWTEGQKTGFFLDQKYNRLAAAKMAPGRRVLDCFTHTGSFALNCAKAGASHVKAIDISGDAIALAKKNAALNGLEGNMSFLKADVFDLLTEMANIGKKEYDFIILDPPAFTKSRATVRNAYNGYKEINMKAMKLLPRGGYLATCSCSHFMSADLFRQMLADAAKDAGVSLRQIEERRQSPDHPILWGVPETEYLKFYIFQVV